MKHIPAKAAAVMLICAAASAVFTLVLFLKLPIGTDPGPTIYIIAALLVLNASLCALSICVILGSSGRASKQPGKTSESETGDTAASAAGGEISPQGKESEEYKDILHHHRRSIRNDYIISLLKGLYSQAGGLKNQLHRFGGSFELGGFILLSYNVHDLRDALLMESEAITPGEVGVVQYGVINIIDELINNAGTGNVINFETRIICIAEISEKSGWTDDPDEAARKFAVMSSENINEALNLPCSVYISRIHNSGDGLAEAYDEVVRVEDYCELLGIESQIVAYGEIDSEATTPLSGRWAFDMERKFISAIQSGDYKSAKKLLNAVIERELSGNHPSIHVAKLRVFSLVNLVMNSVDVVTSHVDRDFFDREIRNITLVDSLTLPDFKKKMDLIFDRIIEHMENKALESAPEWVVKISEYINSNFKDPNLNVAKVADEFGLNAAYASRTFKKHTSKGIFDYILDVRLACAKELLLEGASAVKASEESGFSNQRAMTRAFVKCVGTTPGRFAAQSKQDEE